MKVQKKPISLKPMKAQKTHQSKSSASASVPAAAWKTPHRKNIVVVVVVPAVTFPRKSSNPFPEFPRREKGYQIFSKTQTCDMIWRIEMKP